MLSLLGLQTYNPIGGRFELYRAIKIIAKNMLSAIQKALITCSMLLLLAGCNADNQEYRATHYVFGTLVEFTVYDTDDQAAQRAISQIGTDFRTFHDDWHAWQPGKLTRLNDQLRDGQPHLLDPTLVPLIEQSIQLARQSHGLFNPAIGQLIELWGFHNDEPPRGPPPGAATIDQLIKKSAQMADLSLKHGAKGETWVRSDNPAVQLDFGGFAKGYAIELAEKRLLAAGITNAIVNAGGDLCVMGNHGERPWRIAVRHPQNFGVLAEIELADGECAMTSGNYERFREYNDRRYAHIIDPRTGWPVDHVVSATVITDNGGQADAAATALTVAGPNQWQEIARDMALTQALLVDDDGTIHVSRTLYPRLIWPGEIPADLIIADLITQSDR